MQEFAKSEKVSSLKFISCGILLLIILGFFGASISINDALFTSGGSSGTIKENGEKSEPYLKGNSFSILPQHVHIAVGVNPGEMSISWMTRDTSASVVFYGLHPFSIEQIAYGAASRFEEDGIKRFAHTTLIQGLQPKMTYFYFVGSNETGYSNTFWFRTPPVKELWFPQVAIFGDMGSKNALALPYLQNEIHKQHLDMVIHAGDFAYDLDDNHGFVGDDFMNLIEPVAAHVPYMTCPGNHEHPKDYLEYRHRFKMPINANNKDELHYSFNFGPIHFVSLNVEVYYKHGGSIRNVSSMYHWFQNDLAQVDKKSTPWIIVFGHRPMYCAEGWWDCANNMTKTQVGIDIGEGTLKYGLEEILYDYQVDVAIWAHKHSYERMWPVYNYTVFNDKPRPYVNPLATIHFTTGSGGSSEGHGYPSKDHPKFLAREFPDFGYLKLSVQNLTHIRFDYVSAEQNGQLIDTIMVVKDANVDK